MRKILITTFFLFLFIINYTLETGQYKGIILNQSTKEAIPYTSIIIQELNKGSLTNEQGKFLIKNIPPGKHTAIFKIIGYETLKKEITINPNESLVQKILLERKSLKLSPILITEEKGELNSLPISSKQITFKEIQEKGETKELQEIISDNSGVFFSKNGLGSSNIKIRGFGKDKIQLLINGVQVNNPLNQEINWENWSGISGAAKQIDVQKSGGLSLYGSSKFGGTISVETMGFEKKRNLILKSSIGHFSTSGKSVNEKGDKTEYSPLFNNFSLNYSSGDIKDYNLAYSLYLSRKAGQYIFRDSYQENYTFNFELEKIIKKHVIKTSFLVSPQKNKNIYKELIIRQEKPFSYLSDPALFDDLGREYNRDLNAKSNNEFFKPILTLRDEYQFSAFRTLKTSLFVTGGKKKNQNMNFTYFNNETGEISDKNTYTKNIEGQNLANHARFINEKYDIVLSGFDPNIYEFEGNYFEAINSTNIYSINNSILSYNNQWLNVEEETHLQYGGNLSFNNKISQDLSFTLGTNYQMWHSHNTLSRKDFKCGEYDEGSVLTIDEVDKAYDINTEIKNYSIFGRVNLQPIDQINIFVDYQKSFYNSNIIENKIKLYDLRTKEFTNYEIYSTKSIKDYDGNYLFKDSDYSKSFNFSSPKFAFNYLITPEINLFINTSRSSKEPTIFQWYNNYEGPNGPQTYSFFNYTFNDEGNYVEFVDTNTVKIDVEKIKTYEVGMGYNKEKFKLNITGYYSLYEDKIEEIDAQIKNYNVIYYQNHQSLETYYTHKNLTLNVGDAEYKGLELSSYFNFINLEGTANFSFTKNRWKKLIQQNVFGEDSEVYIGKVVPQSPEKISSGSLFYTLHEIPRFDKIKFGFSYKWWDNYYANFKNEYHDKINYLEGEFFPIENSLKSSKIPAFFQLNFHIYNKLTIKNKEVNLNLDFNNILNKKDNYSEAKVENDFHRIIFQELDSTLYVKPTPLFNIIMSFSIAF